MQRTKSYIWTTDKSSKPLPPWNRGSYLFFLQDSSFEINRPHLQFPSRSWTDCGIAKIIKRSSSNQWLLQRGVSEIYHMTF